MSGAPPLPAPIGILGGTFDPVHCGHLRLALEVRECLGLERVCLMPAPNPRLRAPPRVGPVARREMIERAIAGCDTLALDARELERPGPTSTVETLEAMRAGGERAPLCLVLGSDALARLDEWHRWRELFGLAHLVIARRPGQPAVVPEAVRAELSRRRSEPAAIRDEAAGQVLECQVPLLEISSSRIRARIARGGCVRYLLPEAVYRYITERGLYAEPE